MPNYLVVILLNGDERRAEENILRNSLRKANWSSMRRNNETPVLFRCGGEGDLVV